MEPLEDFILELRQGALTVKHNAALLEVLAPFGYGVVELDELLLHCEEAQLAIRRFNNAEAESMTKFQEFQAIRDATDLFSSNDMLLSQTMFAKEPSARQALGLHQPRQKAHARWHAQGVGFYENILAHPELHERLRKRGITPDHAREGLQRYAAVQTARDAANLQVKTVTELRIARDEAIKGLKQWKREFVQCLRLACRGKPELYAASGFRPLKRRASKKSSQPTPSQPLLPPPAPPVEEPGAEPIAGRPQGEEGTTVAETTVAET